MKKTIALVLSIVMAISLIPFTAFGYDGSVADIEFTPSEPISIYYEIGGEMKTDEKGEEYYHYYGRDDNSFISRGEGDVLTIIDDEGGRHTYTARYNNDENKMYLVGDGDSFEYDEVAMFDEQEKIGNHFTLGDDNFIFVEYKGIRKAVPVSIVMNPVNSIKFVPVSPITIVENSNGHWDSDENGDFYYYDLPYFKAGDKLYVTFAGDENPTEYTFSEEIHEFLDKNSNVLPNSDELYRSKPGDARWTIDDGGEYSIIYSGRRSYVGVSIIENPVKEIKYQRADPVKVFFEVDGREYDGVFEYNIPQAREGDILSVTDKNNETTDYTCRFNQENWRMEFVAENGDVISDMDVEIRADFREHPWTIGSNNPYTVTYLGKSVTLYATVEVDPIQSIEYNRTQAVVYYENSNGWESEFGWYYNTPWFFEGDTITIYYTEGEPKTFTFGYDEKIGYSVFKAEDGEVLDDVHTESNQWDTPWTVGDDNEYYVNYNGRKSAMNKVTIRKNTVTKIEIIKAKPIVISENDKKDIFFPPANQTFKGYEIPFFEEGDKLVIYDSEAGDKEYVFTFNKADGEYYFMCGDEMLDRDAVEVYEEQFMLPWEPDGENNFFTVELRGKTCHVPVTIAHAPASAVKEKNVAATYDNDGSYESVVYCSACKKELSRKKVKVNRLKKTSLAKATVSGIKDKAYTGKALTQSITVKLGGKTLKNGKDYKVTYKNNKNVGKATLTVTGINAYSETITKTFKVNPKGTTLSGVSAASKGFTAKWKKQATQTTGYEIQYSTDKNFKKGVKTATVTKNSTTLKKITKLSGKKKYYVRIRTYKTVSKTKYYSTWSASKSVTTKK